jgi:hypothetical protein
MENFCGVAGDLMSASVPGGRFERTTALMERLGIFFLTTRRGVRHTDGAKMGWLQSATVTSFWSSALLCGTASTDNETNPQRLYGVQSTNRYFKDAFHRVIVNQEQEAINPERKGTKACLHYDYMVPAGGSVVVRLRLTPEPLAQPLKDVDQIIAQRHVESDEFYAAIHPPRAC